MSSSTLPALFRRNAAFSAVTGASAALAATPVAEFLAVPAPAVVGVGAGLLAFAGGLSALSRRRAETLGAWGTVIGAADAAWVVGSVAFLAVHRPGAGGTALLLSASAVVALFAAAQLRAAGRLDDQGPRVVEVVREVAGDPEGVWQVMTDGELYGRLSPNLAKVGPFSTGSTGTPDQRRCWDRMGKHWDETCTAWQPGKSYAVRVHTDAPDYPYPLNALRGTWSVAPAGPGRARVTIRFEFEPRAGAAGRAFAATLAATGPAISKRIIAGWENEVAARSARPVGGGLL